jgi:TolB protein
MTRQIESRLTDTLAAMANHVTEQTLTTPTQYPDGTPTLDLGRPVVTELDLDHGVNAAQVVPLRRRPSRWIGPTLAAATVAALIAGGVTLTRFSVEKDTNPSNHSSAPTSSIAATTHASRTPSAIATPTPTTAAALLPLGHEATRNQIPWPEVGPGWMLAVWRTTTDLTGPATLYLVNPIGGRYNLGGLGARQALVQWSPDSRRALISSGSSTLLERDLRTGEDRSIPLPAFAKSADYLTFTYTHPTGTALVLTKINYAGGPNHATMQKIGTDGRPQVTYPTSAPAAGDIGGTPLYTPDGLTLLVPAVKGVAVLGNGGEFLRVLPNPAGYQSCIPRGWWASDVATVACGSSANASVTNVFLMPIDGGAVSQVTKSSPSGAGDLGAMDVVRVETGTFALKIQGCGGFTAAMVDSNGRLIDLALPTPKGAFGKIGIVNVAASKLIGVTKGGTGCSGQPKGHSLVSYDFSSGTSTALLGPGVNDGSVSQAIVLGGEDLRF